MVAGRTLPISALAYMTWSGSKFVQSAIRWAARPCAIATLVLGMSSLVAGARAPFSCVLLAQSQNSPAQSASTPEISLVGEGWTALARGDLQRASSLANRALTESPRGAAAVALAVEVEIARAGAMAGLDIYERWLGERRVDEPYVLRRIAQAHLRQAVKDRQASGARLEALKALAADGEAAAVADLTAAAAQGGQAEAGILATQGDRRAVEALVSQLRAGGPRRATILALGNSGSPLAIPALTELLADPRDDTRAAAADGLGHLGARDAIPQIKPLLQDQSFPVRMAAAAALYRLEDYSGVTLLDQMMSSENASVRLGAAEAMAARPDATWQAVVRQLTGDPDETVQLGAAGLIAPYDRELSAAVLQRLGQSGNLAIREEASRVLAERVASDFGTLRKLLRAPDALSAARAARRILELTR
jgi:HEAT repeat protein